MIDPGALCAVGTALIFIGVLIIIIAIIMFSVSGTKGKGNVKAGGVVIIGPFPIVFGTDGESIRKVLLLSIALTVLSISAMAIYYLLFR